MFLRVKVGVHGFARTRVCMYVCAWKGTESFQKRASGYVLIYTSRYTTVSAYVLTSEDLEMLEAVFYFYFTIMFTPNKAHEPLELDGYKVSSTVYGLRREDNDLPKTWLTAMSR